MIVDEDVTGNDLCKEIVRHLDEIGTMPNLKRQAEMTCGQVNMPAYKYGRILEQAIFGKTPELPNVLTLWWKSYPHG